MGLCRYCKSWCPQCGIFPAHCSDRTREKFISCDLNTDFRPFTPIEGLNYTREEIINKWKAHVSKMIAIKGV